MIRSVSLPLLGLCLVQQRDMDFWNNSCSQNH